MDIPITRRPPPEPARTRPTGLAWRLAAGLALGAATYVLAHRLPAPFPSAMAGGFGIASGLAWAASAARRSHDGAAARLGLAAAVLATLAATCVLP